MSDVPPPPSADNQLTQPQGIQTQKQDQTDGLMIPFGVLKPIASWYCNLRPLAPLIMRMARIKTRIPPELDEAMAALAGGNPEMLKSLANSQNSMEMQRQGPNMYGPPGQYEQADIPPDEPGSPVMTDDMAEEAYYLHTQKHMGSLAIASYFTNKGSPVSKASVVRYINAKRLEYEEEEEMERQSLRRRIQLTALTATLWFASSVGLHYLFNFLHLF